MFSLNLIYMYIKCKLIFQLKKYRKLKIKKI